MYKLLLLNIVKYSDIRCFTGDPSTYKQKKHDISKGLSTKLQKLITDFGSQFHTLHIFAEDAYMCIFEMFIVRQLQQFEKRLILIKIIYRSKGPALRAPYRDQSVSLSVCLSVCPRYLVRNIPSLPLAQGGSDFTHRVPTVKGCAVILNKVCKGSRLYLTTPKRNFRAFLCKLST